MPLHHGVLVHVFLRETFFCGANNDISSGDIISNCVLSDNKPILLTMVMIMAIPIVVMIIIVGMIKIL